MGTQENKKEKRFDEPNEKQKLNDQNLHYDAVSEVHDLAYDKQKASYEMDVNDTDPDWDHPADYSTVSAGARDDSSAYDVANPYVGMEYAGREDLVNDAYDNAGMRIRDEKELRTAKVDRDLALNDEDYRDDLDAEGYPKRV
ncbi:hypothetical protein ACL9RF_12500 [Sphingobacterium sp. Mn56C]|uniref:hypothetical protein n=1 Tax=Sphingobacterium sp. Mn56C TaxID=3395261 RepID=UPI003BCB114C